MTKEEKEVWWEPSEQGGSGVRCNIMGIRSQTERALHFHLRIMRALGSGEFVVVKFEFFSLCKTGKSWIIICWLYVLANIFSQFLAYLFIFFKISSDEQMLLILTE